MVEIQEGPGKGFAGRLDMALLELRGVDKHFGGLAAVSNLDMDVNEGEIMALIGPNGAGKTTVFNVITGFYTATKGTIRYNGENITHLKPHQIAKRGLVRTFQLTTLFMDFTVLRGVMVARHLHAGKDFARSFLGTEKENLAKSLKIIEFLGLEHLKDELAWNLPHGHQRVLALAMALITEPKLLLLDEPVAGMNPVETQHMTGLIRQIRDQGISVLLVEHDMKTVMGLSDRITVVDFGQKIAEGLPEEITHNEMVIEAYLGREEIVT